MASTLEKLQKLWYALKKEEEDAEKTIVLGENQKDYDHDVKLAASMLVTYERWISNTQEDHNSMTLYV